MLTVDETGWRFRVRLRGKVGQSWSPQRQVLDGFREAKMDPELSLEGRGWIGQGRSFRGERAESEGRGEKMRSLGHREGEPLGGAPREEDPDVPVPSPHKPPESC